MAPKREYDYETRAERQAASKRKQRAEHPGLDKRKRSFSMEQRRRWRLKSKYGIDQQTYDLILRVQGGVCDVCGGTDETALAVDHDHRCHPGDKACIDCIRGLLCRRCNAALGMVEDNIETLRAMIDYLQKPMPRLHICRYPCPVPGHG